MSDNRTAEGSWYCARFE